jgi:hypothetical protein
MSKLSAVAKPDVSAAAIPAAAAAADCLIS